LEPVRTVLNGLDIGILVNNVGMSYDHAQFFDQLDQERVDAIVRVNVSGTTQLTHMVLPGMIERKRGAIVNVSSMSALVNEPLYAVYAGTKAYINNFSLALYYEYRQQGIDVQSSLPGFVATKLSKIRNSSLTVPSASTWARAAVNHIGYEPLSIPYWSHAVMAWLASLLPSGTVASYLFSRGLNIRKLALQKKEKLAKKE